MPRKTIALMIVLSLIVIALNSAIPAIEIKKKNLDDQIQEDPLELFNKKGIFRDEDQVKITYPLSTVPVIVEINDSFILKFESSSFETVYSYISTAYEPVVDTILLDLMTFKKEGDSWHASFTIPEETPEELYNLTVVVLIEGKFYESSQPRAVSVIEKYSNDFEFIHLADFHVGDVRGFAESIRETIGHKSIIKCISEVNMMKPDFVIISGDVTFGALYPFEYQLEYKKCYDLIQMFDVPTYLAPGNHDGYKKLSGDGFKFWEKYFGPLYYSFDYGNYHFQSINSYDWPPLLRLCPLFLSLTWGGYIQDEQLDWIENDLDENSDSNQTFMFMHHNPLWDTKKDTLIRVGYKNRENLLQLIDDYNVSMVLAGHVHRDSVEVVNDTIFVTTTTPQSEIRPEDGYWGYRLVKIRNGSVDSYNYKEPKFSIPTYKLSITYDGLYKAKVENKLEIDVELLVKFSVPIRSYNVINGTVDMIRDDVFLREYYVLVNVPAEDEKLVTLDYIH